MAVSKDAQVVVVRAITGVAVAMKCGHWIICHLCKSRLNGPRPLKQQDAAAQWPATLIADALHPPLSIKIKKGTTWGKVIFIGLQQKTMSV